MRNRMNNILVGISSLFLLAGLLCVTGELPKQSLKINSQILHHFKPASTETLFEMFSQGEYCERLRLNTFYNTFNNEDSTYEDYIANGLGGSLVLKSATFYDFDFGAGQDYLRYSGINKTEFIVGRQSVETFYAK